MVASSNATSGFSASQRSLFIVKGTAEPKRLGSGTREIVLPTALQDQVVDGGRIVIPVGPPGDQRMFRFQRQGERWEAEYLGRFGFVPLLRD